MPVFLSFKDYHEALNLLGIPWTHSLIPNYLMINRDHYNWLKENFEDWNQ